ncbi:MULTISPECIES: DUF5518 domain-containing protein [unclassified Halobacterium]|uniref:DUF5518 domain-containing protein n=1 Tax=unclassified Halobacterium TaxID=2668073 RepID=UPI001965347A|nr:MULTISPECIES: DUF5518 domain-containing protein [unclassified Halobacterium]QRY22538.1 DUF5518 domain-containing protein [Halobacterium sp. GSL-19]QRY24603.1 DUF5518 domain-containing protein [Halobacterium sp. BOL4-2]
MATPNTPRESSLLYDTKLDYVIAALLVVQGLIIALIGLLLVNLDRSAFATELAAELTADPEFTFSISQPALAAAIETLLTWTAIGFLVAGVGTVLIAASFFRYRGRVRDLIAVGDSPPRWHAPLLGGLVATAISFIPFSQLVGGAVAGTASTRSPTLDGALAGAVFGAPSYVIWAAIAAGTFAAGTPFLIIVVLISLLLTVAINVVLSAVGGFAARLLS